MPQPPSPYSRIPHPEILIAELERCRHELGQEAADWVAAVVCGDWLENQDRGLDQDAWTAVSLIYRSARLRQLDCPLLASVLAGCAQAAVLGWRDEVAVRSLIADLDQLPTVLRSGAPLNSSHDAELWGLSADFLRVPVQPHVPRRS